MELQLEAYFWLLHHQKIKQHIIRLIQVNWEVLSLKINSNTREVLDTLSKESFVLINHYLSLKQMEEHLTSPKVQEEG